MLTKDNVTIGIELRFGPDWPGQRCGAKTRRGTACQRPTKKKNGRCRLYGGASTGAKTKEGLARISAANLRYGKFTKDKLEKRRANAAKGPEIRKELRQMERELIAGGLIDKHWRDRSLSEVSQPEISIRPLGASRLINIEKQVVVMATGNNLEVQADLVRLTLLCTLDVNCERPETRQFAQNS